MDLPTHAAFGLAVGLIFFGHVEIGLLIALGAMIPDLDRDWLVKKGAFPEEQRHRALLHNVFIMGAAYLFSPFLALGVFIHMLQDSFTTAKDRGCEWFYPISRLVKHGILAGSNVDLHPDEHIYFYQEDPESKEEDRPAIPWRRVYGPALNSKLLDRGFLFGSLVLVSFYFVFEALSNPGIIPTELSDCTPHLLLFASIAILLLTGMVFNREKQETTIDKKPPNPISSREIIKYLLVVASLFALSTWFWLYQEKIISNIEIIESNFLQLIVGGLLIVISSVIVLKWYTRDKQDTFV